MTEKCRALDFYPIMEKTLGIYFMKLTINFIINKMEVRKSKI